MKTEFCINLFIHISYLYDWETGSTRNYVYEAVLNIKCRILLPKYWKLKPFLDILVIQGIFVGLKGMKTGHQLSSRAAAGGYMSCSSTCKIAQQTYSKVTELLSSDMTAEIWVSWKKRFLEMVGRSCCET